MCSISHFHSQINHGAIQTGFVEESFHRGLYRRDLIGHKTEIGDKRGVCCILLVAKMAAVFFPAFL